MICHPRLLVLCLAGLIAAHSASAEDLEELAIAQKALDTAPAFRVTSTGSSSMTEGMNSSVVEVIRPDLMRVRVEMNGKVNFESFTDGKKTVVSEEGAPYKEAPPELITLLASTRSQLSIVASNNDDLSHKVGQMKFAGHETINGVPASLYSGEETDKPTDANERMPMRDMHNKVKIWISDRDHRPLQAEWNMDGTMQMEPAAKGEPFKQEMKLTFEYDPAMKISLPAVP